MHISRGLLAALALSMTAVLAVSCSSAAQDQNAKSGEEKANNVRTVSDRFAKQPEVIQDADGSGSEVATKLFEKSETAVICGPSPAEQARAASISVASHAPMFVVTEANAGAVNDALNKLKVNTVLAVGNPASLPENKVKMLADGGDDAALAKLTSLKFTKKDTTEPVKDLAAFDAKNPVELQIPGHALESKPVDSKESFPIQSAQDGGSSPVVLVSPETSLAAVANAKAYGSDVRFLPYPDPRVSEDSMKQVAGLADEPLLALGRQFISGDRLKQRIERGESITYQQPGGGELIFPGRRMVALYGHPSGPALGAMGEQPPAEAAERVKQMAAEFQQYSKEPVIPAFEIIATVASEFPGVDGDYSNEAEPEELLPYIDAITAAGGYAVLDLQPGRASLLDQAKRYEELLKRPNVGLALDPEWKIGPSEKPMERVGHVEAAEINDVSDWLAKLVADNKLPQKALVVHQFQLQMIRDRETLNLDHDELAFVLHADGHGSAEDKYGTWDVMRQDLDPRFFMAWKNFYDEDKPMFTPERTMEEVHPKPWFVSYQ